MDEVYTNDNTDTIVLFVNHTGPVCCSYKCVIEGNLEQLSNDMFAHIQTVL